MQDLIIVICISVLALMGHGARRKRWLEWAVRAVIVFVCFAEANYVLYGVTQLERQRTFQYDALTGTCVFSILTLFYLFRLPLSYVLTGVQALLSLRFFGELVRKLKEKGKPLVIEKIFVPASIPHMVGLFIYFSAFGNLLSLMRPSELDFPGLPIPIPIELNQLIAYNGLGLVILSFCGVGVFVSRSPLEVLKRLGLVKPTLPQVAIGISLIFFSFVYDALWSIFTHNAAGDLASKLTMYNSGTFAAGGSFSAAIIIALVTAICAGIGEETLMRGAVQPALGILPAALLHGILHGQFAHTPIFLVQVAVWSTVMGIIKHYTNTTTTIIGHAGFNFVTTFLFAFNP